MINSVYYGLKQEKYAETNYRNWNRLWNIFYGWEKLDSEYVQATIDIVKAHMENHDNCRYVSPTFKTIDKKVFLDNKFSILLDKEQRVTIGDKTGIVMDKVIDISKDTAFYYTNIVAEIDDSKYEERRKKEFEWLLSLLESKLKLVKAREAQEEEAEKHQDMFDELKIEEMKAMEEQNNTFMGKIIKWFKGE
ncbi:hypothetical protein PQE73_gp110 [Bacillus phage vB_BanS_MrDarsey]|uniref:Uncharacterized protein n=2 Tax=Caudoviricetes TaxID=2731619 RepID=A0AAE9CBT3_9CAUD|nr:hypothetical protein PQE73_gp110 [Bacillus phage vB_BanS_MrDarsey]UGO47942.1 hypothetical protein MRDARSEY_110 [Bacillus phage vB_BanS_MrDarsey]